MREERPRDREREREEGSVLKTGKGEFLFASGPPGDSCITPRGYFLSFFCFCFGAWGFGDSPSVRCLPVARVRLGRAGGWEIHPSIRPVVGAWAGGVAFRFLPTSGARGCRARGSRRKRGRGAGDITRAVQVAVVGSSRRHHMRRRALEVGRRGGRRGGPQAAPMVPCAFFAEVWAFGVRGELSLVNAGAKFSRG